MSMTSHARLRHFKQRPADPVAVADANLAVGQAVHGEMFAELPEGEVTSLQLTLPVVISIHRVDKNGALFSAMTVQIALCAPVRTIYPTPYVFSIPRPTPR